MHTKATLSGCLAARGVRRPTPGRAHRNSVNSNPVNYVEVDGHFAVLDESGGKPLSGYGSGANSGSPVATSEETAGMLVATADTYAKAFESMCRMGQYEFVEGSFCQDLVMEGLAARNQTNVLGHELKDPGNLGGSGARCRPGGRRCSCDGETEEVSR